MVLKKTSNSSIRKTSYKSGSINERKKLNSKMLSNKHDDASNYDNLTNNSRSGSTLSELLSPIKKVTLSSNSIDYIDKVILANLIP